MNNKEALETLIEGNDRYVAGEMTSSNLPSDRITLASGQSPIAVVIRCADSRTTPEIIFDQPLGALFVCGVAGNIPTIEIIESIEYAVGFLKCKLIIVMGHSDCGAVTSAMDGNRYGVFGRVSLLPNADVDECISHNAEEGINTILIGSALIEESVKSGDVQIVAGVQDIASGVFELVAQTRLD